MIGIVLVDRLTAYRRPLTIQKSLVVVDLILSRKKNLCLTLFTSSKIMVCC